MKKHKEQITMTKENIIYLSKADTLAFILESNKPPYINEKLRQTNEKAKGLITDSPAKRLVNKQNEYKNY